jgi:two-component sensor histidine kinase
MQKKLSNLILLIALTCTAHSQTNYQGQIDSLKAALTVAKTDSTRSNILLGLLTIYNVYRPEEGLVYRDAALRMAGRVNNKLNLAKINDKIGRIYWQIGRFSEAYGYHFTALRLFEEAGDMAAANYVLIEIGQDYLNDTKFDSARVYLLKAVKLSEERNDKLNKVRALNILVALYENIGNYAEVSKTIYAELKACEELGDKIYMSYAKSSLADYFHTIGNNVEALQYQKESLQLREEEGDLLAQSQSHVSIGNLYLAMGNLAAAQDSYQSGLKVADKMDSRLIMHHILYEGMGNVFRQQGNHAKALEYFLMTAGTLKLKASNLALASTYADIGAIYTRLHQYSLAQKYFDSSWILCKTLDTKVPLGAYYNGLHMLDSATGNWQNAYRHYKQYAIIRDSAFNKEIMRKMMLSQMQYETEKKETVLKAEQEKKDLQAQSALRRQRNIRNFAIAGIAVVLVFFSVAWYQRNRLAREKRKSDALVADKELLLKEIHHRVKNNLEVVSSLLALQSAQIDDPDTREAMQEGQNRVHSIGIVHQKLYQGQNPGAIELKDYFTNLGESIVDSFGAEDRVHIDIDMERSEVDIDTAVPLGLIVNELLTNALKYAFPQQQRGLIRIMLAKQPNGLLHLEVSDNGIGKSEIIQGTGFGSQLISLLTRQLNGSLTMENNNGTHFFFDFRPGK